MFLFAFVVLLSAFPAQTQSRVEEKVCPHPNYLVELQFSSFSTPVRVTGCSKLIFRGNATTENHVLYISVVDATDFAHDAIVDVTKDGKVYRLLRSDLELSRYLLRWEIRNGKRVDVYVHSFYNFYTNLSFSLEIRNGEPATRNVYSDAGTFKSIECSVDNFQLVPELYLVTKGASFLLFNGLRETRDNWEESWGIEARASSRSPPSQFQTRSTYRYKVAINRKGANAIFSCVYKSYKYPPNYGNETRRKLLKSETTRVVLQNYNVTEKSRRPGSIEELCATANAKVAPSTQTPCDRFRLFPVFVLGMITGAIGVACSVAIIYGLRLRTRADSSLNDYAVCDNIRIT